MACSALTDVSWVMRCPWPTPPILLKRSYRGVTFDLGLVGGLCVDGMACARHNLGSVGFHEYLGIYVRLRDERSERQRLVCCVRYLAMAATAMDQCGTSGVRHH